MRENDPILLLGLEVRVSESTNKRQRGIKGRAVGETMKTVIISTKQGDKVVPKNGSTFEVVLPSGEVQTISGKKIIGRPEQLIRRSCSQ